MNALAKIIARRIATEGPMSLAEYMSVCLTHPQHGYYTQRNPLGAAGDFTTAPEISQMFGELLGLGLAQYWLDLGRPDPFTLAELGPGRGTLMADILRATRGVPGFHSAMRLELVEVSQVLRREQAAALSDYNPQWVDRFDARAEQADTPLFLVANEFFDALPIRQFIRTDDAWRERVIGAGPDDTLQFGLAPPSRLDMLEPHFNETAQGDIVQMQSAAGHIGAIGRWIGAHGGVAIVVDYGAWQVREDTFQAVANHSFANPLEAPGIADLTAHVDFSDLAANLDETTTGTALCDQGAYLQALGIEARAHALSQKLGGAALENHLAAHKRLTHPGEMGSLFKVWAIYRSGQPVPPGLMA